MLQHIYQLAESDSTINKIILHVQISNEDALNFYERHGFTNVELVERYYKNIDPADAYLLVKTFF